MFGATRTVFRFEMARVLITGIEGFTGRYLSAELSAHGFEVVGFGTHNSSSERSSLGHRVVPCNLLDEKATIDAVSELRPDAVVHLAAIAFVAHGNIGEIYSTNIVGTRNLLSALAISSVPIQSVVLASSANIYGNCESSSIEESQPPAPANDYAVSKLAMEFMARTWSERLPITIVRPFNYTGIGQSEQFLLPKIVAHFRARKDKIELGNIDVIRDFSDVRFVVQCYRKIIDRAFTSSGANAGTGRAFNICSGIGYSLENILQLMQNISGLSPEVIVNPAFVRKNEVRSLIGSRRALDGFLGNATPVPIEQTLRWMYAAK
jgi:GDP-6-deoxy-D-talose 4-dehydrogenase